MALFAKTHLRYATEACWWCLEGCGLRKWLTLWVMVEQFFMFVFCWSVIVNFPKLNMLCFVVLLLFIPGGSMLKIHLPVQETQETWVWSLGREDPLEEEVATPSSILVWRIPLSEEPGRLQSTRLQTHTTCNQINQSLYIHFFSERMTPWISGHALWVGITSTPNCQHWGKHGFKQVIIFLVTFIVSEMDLSYLEPVKMK